MQFLLYVGDIEGPKELLQRFNCPSVVEAKKEVDKMYDELADHPTAPKGGRLQEAISKLVCVGTMTYHHVYLLDALRNILSRNPLVPRTGIWIDKSAIS